MKKGIAKRQRKPFDYASAESFALDASADDTINNSYYFSAHDYKAQESFYCRLGQRNSHNEIWFYYEKGGEKYFFGNMIVKGESPLRVCKEEGVWRISFGGELIGNDGERVEAAFAGAFESGEDAVDFFTHMPPVRTAKAMAQEKWNKKFFAEVRANNQVHYEQTGTLRGELKIGDRAIKIDMPCVRDHSFGKRDWNYMNNHMWLMAVNSANQLNFSMVSYPAMTALEVGNFKRQGNPMAYVLKADYDRAQISQGVVPQSFAVKLSLDNGETLDAKITKIGEKSYVFQDGQYVLVEGIADFDINGEKFRGIAEIGINGDKSRVFNGKNAGKIKA